MDKKYFYIWLFCHLFAAELLAMGEEEFGEYLLPKDSDQSEYDIPVGYGFGNQPAQHLSKREASGSTPSAKKARKSSSDKNMIICSQDCGVAFKRSSNNLYTDIMMHLLFSQKHNVDNYNFASAMVENEAQWDKKEDRWVVKCSMELCNTRIFAAEKNKDKLTQGLIRHWCSKKHSFENSKKIHEYVYAFDSGKNNGECFFDDLFGSLLKVSQNSQNIYQESSRVGNCTGELPPASAQLSLNTAPIPNNYSLSCIYHGCDIKFTTNDKYAFFHNLMSHIYSRVHHAKLYNEFSCIKGKSKACPKGCRKTIPCKDKGQHCRDLLLHLHSKKHAPEEYQLLQSYVAKSLPELFWSQIAKKNLNQDLEEIRQEYIRLFPEQNE